MKTEIEVQKENVKVLLGLIKENPNLRVIPMVDTDVVAGDDFSCWLGRFSNPEIDCICEKDERIYFKSLEMEELIQHEIDNIHDEAQLLHETHPLFQQIEKRAKERVEKYGWEKVIAVWITTP